MGRTIDSMQTGQFSCQDPLKKDLKHAPFFTASCSRVAVTISHPHHFLICLAKAACCEESPESPQQGQAEQWLSHEPTQEWAHLGHLVHSVHIAGFWLQQGHWEQTLPSVTKDWFPEHLHKRLIDLIGNSRRAKAKAKTQLLAKYVLHSSWPSWPAGDCIVN